MRVSAVYGFNDAPSASRFLNDVNSSPSLEHAKAKLFDRDKVQVTYVSESRAFDNTLSVLDELSDHYGGKEIQS